MATVLLILALQDVDGLIRQLGDDRIEARDRASEELLKLGAKALEKLKEAAASSDPEIAARARALVAEIDFPEPGAAVNGLAVAVKVRPGEGTPIQVRWTNVGEGDLDISGIFNAADVSDYRWTLTLDGAKDRHLLSGKLPEAAAGPVVLKKGESRTMSATLGAWCSRGHNWNGGRNLGCQSLTAGLKPGAHKVSMTVKAPKGEGAAWRGEATSNEFGFEIKP